MFRKIIKNKNYQVLTIIISIILVLPIIKVIAANNYTITYKSNNGSVIATKTYIEGNIITLDNYPSGAIAWVDKNDTSVRSINANAKGMAYINYCSDDPNNSLPKASMMKITMPSRNMELIAFYGDYQNGNEPRLIQYHLELKYMDANSNKFLSFNQQYRNVNAPSGYVINLPESNYFNPITGSAQDPSSGQNTNFTSSLGVNKWVKDSSYTGSQTEDPSKLYNPKQLIYVDPNDYNQIYDVMVDQSLDYITGQPIQPPVVTEPPVPPTVTPPTIIPAVPPKITIDNGTYITIRFEIDPIAKDSSNSDIAAPNGAGFTINDGSTTTNYDLNGINPSYYEKTVIYGTEWQDIFNYTSGGTPPVHNDLSGSGFTQWYWTQDDGTTPINVGIAPNSQIKVNLLFKLHYVEDSTYTVPTTPPDITNPTLTFVKVKFNISTDALTYNNSIILGGAPTGAGFKIFDGTNTTDYDLGGSNQSYFEKIVPYGTTWGDIFNYSGSGQPPVHNNVVGYSNWYWTQDGDTDPIDTTGLNPTTPIQANIIFTLHYRKDPVVTFKIEDNMYNGDGTPYDLASNYPSVGFTAWDKDNVSHAISLGNDYSYTIPMNTAYGTAIQTYASGKAPVHNNVTGFDTFYWTQDGETDKIDLEDPSILSTTIGKDMVFRLNYVHNQTITFNFDDNVYDESGNVVDTVIGLSIDSLVGFDYNYTPGSGTIMYNDITNYVDYSVGYNETFGDYFGTNFSLPTPKVILGYSNYYWTVNTSNNHLGQHSVSDTKGIKKDYTFTLHYIKDPDPLIDVVVKLNTGSYEYNGQERKVAGFRVIKFNGSDVDIAEDLSLHEAQINNAIELLFNTSSANDYIAETEVGTYFWNTQVSNFSIDDSTGGTTTSDYKITVLPGGLTILPKTTTYTPPDGGEDKDKDNGNKDKDSTIKSDSKVSNTGNNILVYLELSIISILALTTGLLYTRKDK